MASSTLSRHERFYFEDGNFRLQVDDTEYQVHLYLFKIHARRFPFTRKYSPSTMPLCHIKDAKRPDFDRLLACLYPTELMFEVDRTVQDWTSILKLASRWGFDSIRKRAVREIERLAPPIDKIELGHIYDVSEFLEPAYLALCQSSVPLSEDEGKRLGMKDVINIYRVRQELWGQGTKRVPVNEVLVKVKLYFDTVARSKSPPSPNILSPAIERELALPQEGHDGDAMPEKSASSSSDYIQINQTPSPPSWRSIEAPQPEAALATPSQASLFDSPLAPLRAWGAEPVFPLKKGKKKKTSEAKTG